MHLVSMIHEQDQLLGIIAQKNVEDIETSSTPYTCRWEPLRF